LINNSSKNRLIFRCTVLSNKLYTFITKSPKSDTKIGKNRRAGNKTGSFSRRNWKIPKIESGNRTAKKLFQKTGKKSEKPKIYFIMRNSPFGQINRFDILCRTFFISTRTKNPIKSKIWPKSEIFAKKWKFLMRKPKIKNSNLVKNLNLFKAKIQILVKTGIFEK